jgi:hypothetical protein
MEGAKFSSWEDLRGREEKKISNYNHGRINLSGRPENGGSTTGRWHEFPASGTTETTTTKKPTDGGTEKTNAAAMPGSRSQRGKLYIFGSSLSLSNTIQSFPCSLVVLSWWWPCPCHTTPYSKPSSFSKRLATIRIVKPDKAAGIEMRILQMAQKGQLRQQVSEQQLIGMMEQLSEAAAKNNKITFQRRKVAGWSDSEDDDDDSDLL